MTHIPEKLTENCVVYWEWFFFFSFYLLWKCKTSWPKQSDQGKCFLPRNGNKCWKSIWISQSHQAYTAELGFLQQNFWLISATRHTHLVHQHTLTHSQIPAQSGAKEHHLWAPMKLLKLLYICVFFTFSYYVYFLNFYYGFHYYKSNKCSL